jgi:hypothetical protein
LESHSMSDSLQSKADAKNHAAAIAKAAEFFSAAAKRGELPLTPEEFETRVTEFYRGLEAKLELSNALLLAVQLDQPCPQSLFAPWASTAAIWQWRKAEKNPLPAVSLNGKVCIKPSDFFAALKTHGKEAAP